MPRKSTKTENVKMPKSVKAPKVEKTKKDNVEEQNIKGTVTPEPDIKEVEKVLDKVDTTIEDTTITSEPKIEEVQKIVEEINNLNKEQKEFTENFEKAKSQEEAETIVKKEIEKIEKEKEKVEKIINRSQREITTSWNGISDYGF